MLNKISAAYHRRKADNLRSDAALDQIALDKNTKQEQIRIDSLHARSIWHSDRAKELNPPSKSL